MNVLNRDLPGNGKASGKESDKPIGKQSANPATRSAN
jgi:hypothetical protein